MAKRFNNTELTDAAMQAARDSFAENAQLCINEAVSGEVFVNDLAAYCEWRARDIAEGLAGKFDHTLAFLQRAYYIQTGECVALLP